MANCKLYVVHDEPLCERMHEIGWEHYYLAFCQLPAVLYDVNLAPALQVAVV
jgi:hypothetical protein